ncbi:MAG: tetratricopeptide repeat protein [Gemmatimonadaceae bacterium]
MSGPDGSPPPDALADARAAIIRLDPSRHPEDLAADLLEAWSAVEKALRTLLGGSAASGTELVREARQRRFLTFDQANALAAFHAVRERTQGPDYHPTSDDVDAARRALVALNLPAAGAGERAPAAVGAPAPATGAMRHQPPPLPDFAPERAAAPARSRARLWAALVVLVIVGLVGGAVYYWFGGPRRDGVVNRAIAEFDAGNRDSAAADFRRALLIDPEYVVAHVYLARIARDAGNLPAANQELQLALTADPSNAIALREMGAYLYQVGNYDLARKFYVRAVSANPDDPASMGYLGCTLIRLGRIDEGERWITRAGPGVWTSCVGASTPPDTLHH